MRRVAGREAGQAAILLLGVMGVLVCVALVLASFGQALGARGRAQRVADLAAVSGARQMRDVYERLFEPPYLELGVPNPRHLSRGRYLTLAAAAAVTAARGNGLRIGTRTGYGWRCFRSQRSWR